MYSLVCSVLVKKCVKIKIKYCAYCTTSLLIVTNSYRCRIVGIHVQPDVLPVVEHLAIPHVVGIRKFASRLRDWTGIGSPGTSKNLKFCLVCCVVFVRYYSK